MTKLSEMPNIARILEQKLMEAGINSAEELITTGSRDAFLRLKTRDNGACFSMLCAMEGAVRGVRWHDLDCKTKADLKSFYESVR
jgi:DNA transformation protein